MFGAKTEAALRMEAAQRLSEEAAGVNMATAAYAQLLTAHYLGKIVELIEEARDEAHRPGL